MIIEKTYRNDDNLFRVLIKKDDTYYLIEEFIISGTFYHNYCIYEDIYFKNNLEGFMDEKNENERYWVNSFATIEECIEYLEGEV